MIERICVTGAGGFIGTWLVRRLKAEGYWVRGVDLKRPVWSETEADEFLILDLREKADAEIAVHDVDWVFALAADMGGMFHLTTKQAEIIRNNTFININTIEAAQRANVKRYLFSSSACVYNTQLQSESHHRPLVEGDAYPALPQASYGWEKLHTEHLCREYRKAEWLDTVIVRFHNCYGSLGSWQGGREKAPAALSRKIAVAKITGNPRVEIWGDGQQVRTYMHVQDCVEGLLKLMKDGFPGPLNLGRDRTLTVDELADITASIAGVEIEKVHVLGPEGVRWRNSDNSLCREILGWEPPTPVEEGMIETYQWVEQQVKLSMKK